MVISDVLRFKENRFRIENFGLGGDGSGAC